MKLLTSILSLSLIGAALPLISVAQSPRPDAIKESPSIVIARSGSQPSRQAPAEHFTGSVHITPLFAAKPPSRTSGGSVTFDAGARSASHTHPRNRVDRDDHSPGLLLRLAEGDVSHHARERGLPSATLSAEHVINELPPINAMALGRG